MNPSKQDLLWFFNYNKESGILTWKNVTHSNKIFLIGEIAGTFDDEGYRVIRLNKKAFKVHRLIWFLENGTWPEQIDHKNGDRSKNTIGNLRDSTPRLNGQNKKLHRSGRLVGSTFNKFHQRWQAQIEIDKKRIHLGYYSTEFEAHQAYVMAL